jgi:hypothetical protein
VAQVAQPAGISADALSQRVDAYLSARGFRGAGTPDQPPIAPITAPAPDKPAAAVGPAAEFVCEEDVRQAVRHGKKITLGERTIVTPAARDMGEQHKVFVLAAFPRA